MITESEDNTVKCSEDGTVLRRKRKAPYRRLKKNHSANIESGNISLLPEDSTTLKMTVGDDNTANCGENETISRKKKRTPNRRLKNDQSITADYGDILLLPEDSTTLVIAVGDDNTANCGEDDSVLRRKKKAPSRRFKKIQCTDPASGDQDISLVTEDLTVLGISSGDKKRVSKRNHNCTQSSNTVSGNKDVPEELTILKIAEGEKSTVNQGEVGVAPGNEKSASNKCLKRNRSTEHDISLTAGDLTIASIADAVLRKKKRSINKHLKTNNCIKPAQIDDSEDNYNYNNKVVDDDGNVVLTKVHTEREMPNS
ncbi:hypothetical protein MKX01_034477 [Papaver californicum]|nr:hypothetical protein MKX01_034477 [Papaver californicum]